MPNKTVSVIGYNGIGIPLPLITLVMTRLNLKTAEAMFAIKDASPKNPLRIPCLQHEARADLGRILARAGAGVSFWDSKSVDPSVEGQER